jgi:hypothetical protein
MSRMTLSAAATRLSLALENLWLSVSELALTVQEDRPAASDLAAVDDLAERVSEFQAELSSARTLLAGDDGDDGDLMLALPRIAAHLDAFNLRYWRDLRSLTALTALRQAARRRGGELPAWQRIVEAGADRCEKPLADATGALNVCWQEICHSSMPRRSW